METSSKALRLLLLAALLPISLLGGCRARQRTVQSSYAERDSLHTELRAQTQQRHTTGEVHTEQTDSTMRHNTATEAIARNESRSGRAPLGLLLGVLLATLAALILLRVAAKRKGR